MLFNYSFHGASKVESNAGSTLLSFSPDVSRPPAFFKGKLNRQIEFREAISALHKVVVSDMRFKKRDTSAYKAWLETQESELLAEASAVLPEVASRIKSISHELGLLRHQRDELKKPYYKTLEAFRQYVFKYESNLSFIFDPVITVHPDEVFFECFSLDESTYGRVGCSYEVFRDIGEFSCGTTNIDYSEGLYIEFQKIREYKDTDFNIDPGGFSVQVTGEEVFTEKKIELPDSWVRGFLQVSSAMTMPMKRVDFHPLDIHNICHLLRRMKEKSSPRSLRIILTPGQPVLLRFEPWNIELRCPRSVYHGSEADEIRLWGRRRLLILERTLPLADSYTAYFMGTGLPSFFIARMNHISFTLGLSGWTANDWSRSGGFDLMGARTQTDVVTRDRVFAALRENWLETPAQLSRRLNVAQKVVEGALTAWTQAGRVMYDLNKGVYRVRELSREPLPVEKLRFSDPREQEATAWADANAVQVSSAPTDDGKLKLQGVVKDAGHEYKPVLEIDNDERICGGSCSCEHYYRNKMFKGPCAHQLALRIVHGRKTRWAKWLMN